MIQKMRKKLKCKKGFTLIELIVVIAILGILAMIAIPRITDVQESAKKQADITNANTIANQVAILRAQGKFPLTTALTLVDAPAATGDTKTSLDNLKASLRGTWPTAQSKAANSQSYIVTCSADDVITITVNTKEIYPTLHVDFK